MPPICSDWANPERKLVDHVVDELNGTTLVMVGEDP